MRGQVKISLAIATCLLAATPIAAQAPDLTIIHSDLDVGPGNFAAFDWTINNARGVAGPTPDANNEVSGWSLIRVVLNPLRPMAGDVLWNATNTAGNQFQLALFTFLNPSTVGQENFGTMANFDPSQTYVWPFITFQGTYSGPTDSATLTADTLMDVSQFVNPVAPAATFTLDLIQNPGGGGAIDIVYSPVPEPGTLGLVAIGLLGVWRARRRTSLC